MDFMINVVRYNSEHQSQFPFLFCFQAILFYIPRWLWKNWEAGKIAALKMDLDLGIISEAEKRQKKKLLLDYLYANLKNHNFWAYRYFFCEFLALLNVLGKLKKYLQKKESLNHHVLVLLVMKTLWFFCHNIFIFDTFKKLYLAVSQVIIFYT